jgi:seryl-tRNA synthetase
MINNCKDFYDSLGISYRIVNIVSGALNNAASQKYDLEAWFPASGFYGELVSCSNVLDYFSKRINAKILESNEYVHMLNCTLVANTRTMCVLMEQYQTDDGMDVPKVLRKYIGCDKISFK